MSSSALDQDASARRGYVGVGVPQAAVADAAAARMRHYLETGEYVNVIADGGMRTGGEIAKAITCGADAVMLGSAFARAEEPQAVATRGGWLPSIRPFLAAPASAPGLRVAGGDTRRARPRERRDAQPHGRPEDEHGHDGLPEH